MKKIVEVMKISVNMICWVMMMMTMITARETITRG